MLAKRVSLRESCSVDGVAASGWQNNPGDGVCVWLRWLHAVPAIEQDVGHICQSDAKFCIHGKNPSAAKGKGLAETDFIDLYRRLKVSPDCTLSELKLAYRRHVALLHPDRRVGGTGDVHAAGLLQKLTAQYGAAMEFQRRHGRLPGAATTSRPPAATPAIPAYQPAAALPAMRESSRSRLPWIVAVGILGVLLWSISPLSTSSDSTGMEPDDMAIAPASASALPGELLSLGMTSENVRNIEGDPLVVHGDRWEYGPSWITFERDAVTDWYSSPLHALKAADSRPANRHR